jgi:Histidine kinase-, DNA gyrase B-, and HSP90-like ATPase
VQPIDPIEELKSTSLFKFLEKIDSEYAERCKKFVAVLAPILATTIRHFPFYTRHDAHHGFNVLRRIEQVIKKDCFAKDQAITFSAAEIFLLIAAAYAHDLGMTVFKNEEDSLLNAIGVAKDGHWETNPVLQNFLRREHSRRGGKFVEENAEKLGVPHNLVGALDKMMRAHNLDLASMEKEFHTPFAAQGQELDVLQLATVLCVGDALEFSDTRVVDGVLDRIHSSKTDEAQVSYRENMKHVCVGDSLAIREDGSILVSGTFSDEEVLALAHRTFDEIESWIRGYCDLERGAKKLRLSVRPEPFTRNLVYTEGRFERLGVRLSKKNVIDLIASNAVWQNNQGIAVRELLQNAVEACRYRQHHSSNADNYRPQVEVVFNRKTRTILVSDNGCGMSERTVLNNFLTIGSSRAKETGYANPEYAPIARFGIGFWSVFTIAECVFIETAEFEPYKGDPTKADGAVGFNFEVSLGELKEYTVFRPATRQCGTTIKLTLRNEVVIDDVFSQSSSLLVCSEIPVSFEIDESVTHLPQKLPNVTERDVLGERVKLKDDYSIELFTWQKKEHEIEVSLGIAYRMENGRATFLAEPGASLLQILPRMSGAKTSICGFITSGIRTLIGFDLNRVGCFFANHLSPKGFEFSIDRNNLQPTFASLNFAECSADLVHQGYRQFLKKTNSYDPQTIALLREQAAMHGGNTFDTFTATELQTANKHYPDLISIRLYKVSKEKEFEQVTPEYFDLNGLGKLSGTVFFVQNRLDLQKRPGEHINFDVESEQVVELTYQFARSWANIEKFNGPVFVMAADRIGSMLFDADPQSSVGYMNLNDKANLCIQFVCLDNIDFDAPPKNILAEVHGRWSGTVYSREFKTPNSRPYQFLGRHRVLIETSSKVEQHIKYLAAENRKREVADLIADLLEDSQGYTPDHVSLLFQN